MFLTILLRQHLFAQCTTFPSPMNRSKNFTDTEKNLLLNLVDKYKNSIECKRTYSKTLKQKREARADLCEEFNSTSTYTKREVKNLQSFWKNLKTRAKSNCAYMRRERLKTGGGPSPQLQKDTERVESKYWSQIFEDKFLLYSLNTN